MSFPYLPFYIGDHLRDTRHLATEEQGAYLLLIFEYWSKGSLPDDDKLLARIAGLSPMKWDKTKPVIQEFFHDGWHHKRIDAELEKAKTKSAKRQEAANKRWEKDHANASGDATCKCNANAMQTGSGYGYGYGYGYGSLSERIGIVEDSITKTGKVQSESLHQMRDADDNVVSFRKPDKWTTPTIEEMPAAGVAA